MSDWFDGQLSDSIATLDAGVSVNAEDRPHGSGEIGVLKTSAISGGQFIQEQNKTVVERERSLVAEPVQGNSILVSRMNTPALVGESCFVRDAFPSIFLPDRIWQLKPNGRFNISMRWLSFVLQSTAYRRHVEIHATGTSGSMKNLPKSKLLDFPISYPAPPEQAKIAHVLDTLDTLIQATEASINKLKAVKRGLLHDLLMRGVDANGEERLALPASIIFKPLSELAYINPKTLVSIPTNTEVSFVPMGATSESGEVVGREIRKLGAAGAGMALFQNGDVLVAKISPCFENGKGGLAQNLKNGIGFGSTEFHVLRSKPANHPGFIHYWTISPSFRSRGESFMTGTAGQRRVMSEFFENFLVPAFNFDEQVQIVKILDAQTSRINNEVEALKKLRVQKLGLMDDLLTGRVRVTPLLSEAAQK